MRLRRPPLDDLTVRRDPEGPSRERGDAGGPTGAIERAERSWRRMPLSRSRSTQLAGRSAGDPTMSSCATPGSAEEPSGGSEHSGDGSRLPACGRIATEHE